MPPVSRSHMVGSASSPHIAGSAAHAARAATGMGSGGPLSSLSEAELHQMLSQAASRLVAAGLADPPEQQQQQQRGATASAYPTRVAPIRAPESAGPLASKRVGSVSKLHEALKLSSNPAAASREPVEEAYMEYLERSSRGGSVAAAAALAAAHDGACAPSASLLARSSSRAAAAAAEMEGGWTGRLESQRQTSYAAASAPGGGAESAYCASPPSGSSAPTAPWSTLPTRDSAAFFGPAFNQTGRGSYAGLWFGDAGQSAQQAHTHQLIHQANQREPTLANPFPAATALEALGQGRPHSPPVAALESASFPLSRFAPADGPSWSMLQALREAERAREESANALEALGRDFNRDFSPADHPHRRPARSLLIKANNVAARLQVRSAAACLSWR